MHQYHFELDEAGQLKYTIIQEDYEKPHKEIKIIGEGHETFRN